MNSLPVKLPEKIDGFRSESINGIIDYLQALTPIPTPSIRQEFRHDGIAMHLPQWHHERMQMFFATVETGYIPIDPGIKWPMRTGLNLSAPSAGADTRTFIHSNTDTPTLLKITRGGKYYCYVRLYTTRESNDPAHLGDPVLVTLTLRTAHGASFIGTLELFQNYEAATVPPGGSLFMPSESAATIIDTSELDGGELYVYLSAKITGVVVNAGSNILLIGPYQYVATYE